MTDEQKVTHDSMLLKLNKYEFDSLMFLLRTPLSSLGHESISEYWEPDGSKTDYILATFHRMFE